MEKKGEGEGWLILVVLRTGVPKAVIAARMRGSNRGRICGRICARHLISDNSVCCSVLLLLFFSKELTFCFFLFSLIYVLFYSHIIRTSLY